MMSNEQFIERCKELVLNYTIEHLDKSASIPEFDVYLEE